MSEDRIPTWATLMTQPERCFLDCFIEIGPDTWAFAADAHQMEYQDVVYLQHRLLAEPETPATSRELRKGGH